MQPLALSQKAVVVVIGGGVCVLKKVESGSRSLPQGRDPALIGYPVPCGQSSYHTDTNSTMQAKQIVSAW